MIIFTQLLSFNLCASKSYLRAYVIHLNSQKRIRNMPSSNLVRCFDRIQEKKESKTFLFPTCWCHRYIKLTILCFFFFFGKITFRVKEKKIAYFQMIPARYILRLIYSMLMAFLFSKGSIYCIINIANLNDK